MKRLSPPALLVLTLSLVVGLAAPALAAEERSAFGDPLAPLPERVTAAEEAETRQFQPLSAGDVVVRFGGFGHGIGMPQYGAQAMAQQGHGYEQILQHFYTGARFSKTDLKGGSIVQHANPVVVGIGPSRNVTEFTPQGGPVTICFGVGSCQEHTAQAGETWFIFRYEGNCVLTKKVGGAEQEIASKPCSDPAPDTHGKEFARLTWENQPTVKVHFPGFSSARRTYARGSISFITASGGLLHVRAHVDLERYLYGLGEVPNSWHPEALKAQAVAARTFALYRIWSVRGKPGGERLECGCQLLATTADQAYHGWNSGSGSSEGGVNGDKWQAAVDATEAEAMWHPRHGSGRALEAYYFSSTGGATENNEERWGGSPYEYLRSRPDPGAMFFNRTFTQSQFAQKLGFGADGIVTMVNVPARYASGRPKQVIVTGKTANGSILVKEYTSTQFRNALGHDRGDWLETIEGVTFFDGVFPPDADRPVLHNRTTGQWTYVSGTGAPQQTIYFGNPGDIAFMGDWDGDGEATPGLYRQSDGFVYLRNSNTQGVADITFYFGNPGDIPLIGDFDGDGKDTVSIYRPSEARFYIINKLGQNGGGLGKADYSFVFGNPGDVPFVGDWNGDGKDTPGLRRPTDGFVYLRNSNTQGIADISFFYGNPGDVVFAGDWNADGRDSIGLYRPSNGTIYLRNALSTGVADITLSIGGSQHRAVAGWGWD